MSNIPVTVKVPMRFIFGPQLPLSLELSEGGSGETSLRFSGPLTSILYLLDLLVLLPNQPLSEGAYHFSKEFLASASDLSQQHGKLSSKPSPKRKKE